MTRPMVSIAAQLNAAQVLISNSLADAEIKSLVAAFGYGTQRLNEGKQLYLAALGAVNAQKISAGAQRMSTAELKVLAKEARGAYQARAIFDRGQLATLGLTGRMPPSTAGFLTAASTLFSNAASVEELATALAEYGYAEGKLASKYDKVVAFDRANQVQEAAKGAAQQSTRDQDAALAALNEWAAQYIKIVKVALRNKQELLAKLGIVVRTRRVGRGDLAGLSARH